METINLMHNFFKYFEASCTFCRYILQLLVKFLVIFYSNLYISLLYFLSTGRFFSYIFKQFCRFLVSFKKLVQSFENIK